MTAATPRPYWTCDECRLTGARGIGDVGVEEVEYLAGIHNRLHHGCKPVAVVIDPASNGPAQPAAGALHDQRVLATTGDLR